ncbi:SGNH/GDSL hydrolase family protein [Pseudonocardia phyllosphaerae]|uniref:SGNH/GDSL hydrolase family protein n=1 Tax=Pseudonocardia phyllosphaerae TaxID=3390502 RepID=UPI00397C8F12
MTVRVSCRRPSRAFATVVLVVATALVATAAPALAGPKGSGLDYVALGDSYAAGVGAAPAPGSGDCRQSNSSYPALWAARNRPRSFVSKACSGSNAGGVLFRQARAVSKDTDLVTITVGGNDVGFAPVIATCTAARDDASCLRAVHGGEHIARLFAPGGLISVIVAARLQSAHAQIVVLGYPKLYGPGSCRGVRNVPNAARRAALDRAADVLNGALADGARRYGAQFVDVSGRFAGHGLCGADPWLTPPSKPLRRTDYHPTAAGYARGYLPALSAAVTRS